jgi:hypothetical protein
VHIVVLAWLYVMFAVALTLRSTLAGIVLFAVAGLAPVLLWFALRIRQLRAQRERAPRELPHPDQGLSAAARARRR